MTLNIDVIEGDITREPADALITAISSSGQWFGGVDRAIKSVAGELFHHQATMALPIHDGETLIATGGRQNRGSFRNVLFVVDNLQRPLDELALIALRAAESAGLGRITLPAIRTGYTLGKYEPTAEVAVGRLAQAVQAFAASNPRSVSSIRFVIFRDQQTTNLLGRKLRQIRG